MQDFISDITKQVEKIISDNPKVKDRFQKRLEAYRQIREKFIKTSQQYQFDPDAWIKRWYGNPQYNDIIADVPKNPKKPDESENIICEYAVLSVIHDYPWENAQYPKLTKPDDKRWACPIWDSVTGCRQFNLENGESLVDRTDRIIDALEHVKADLASLSTETRQNATPAKVISIKNFKGVLGDVQAENVQTGDYASIRKHSVTMEKKKGIIVRLLKIIGAIVGFLAALFTCIYSLWWLWTTFWKK